ncbi:hemerythrin domain-containing protein [Dactylosporangium sp. AC04546]|uniref:hemerythrin domain-containing protein n=1 Tax=Dactylosporangium sp. AC04546 TaxID=2862460 RepID=UPI001EE0BC75|nr:hemerythrin domain-containing protein [Dactylosporangium sp. AC04546]WVK85720.1 hemerythrin domain-containing protein [Dactylosporangium sp. AC04546]
MATDAVTLIVNDHRVMERLFDKLRSGHGDRQQLLDECAARLTAHSHAEEEKVYPVLAEIGEQEEAHQGADEHHQAERMLHDLQRMSPEGPDFEDRLEDFIEAVRRHVEKEESEILPALQEALPAERLDELGAAFEEVRLRELQVAGLGLRR